MVIKIKHSLWYWFQLFALHVFFLKKKTFCKNSKSDKNAHFIYCIVFSFFICLTWLLWWKNLCASKFSKVVVLWMANSNNFTSISWALADMILDKSFLWNNNKKETGDISSLLYWYQCTIYRIVVPSQKPYRIPDTGHRIPDTILDRL